MPDPRISDVVSKQGHAATVAWAHLGEGELASLPDPELAIAAAAELGNVRALQSVQSPKSLRKAAAAALHRLRSRGVKVEDAAQPRQFTLGAETVDVPPRAWLGRPDAEGRIPLVLTATDAEGSCVAEVPISEPEARIGHGHANRGEVRELWRRLEADPTMKEVPFVLGLHLADRVAGGRHDHGWEHLVEKVPATMLARARLYDPSSFAADAIEELVGENRLLSLPITLVDVRMAVHLLASREEGDDSWMDDGADAAITDENRENLAAAADTAATVFALHGRLGARDDARAVADKIRAGTPGREMFAIRSAVIRGTMMEVLHRARQ